MSMFVSYSGCAILLYAAKKIVHAVIVAECVYRPSAVCDANCAVALLYAELLMHSLLPTDVFGLASVFMPSSDGILDLL